MEKEFVNMFSDFIYEQYFLNSGRFQKAFEKIDLEEFIILKCVSKSKNEKVYIKELAKFLRLSNTNISKLVGQLRDKGFVKWTHDGNGDEGTYVTLTEDGLRFLLDQENRNANYYEKVIDKFGMKRMGKLIAMLKDLDGIMKKEMEEELQDGMGTN
ncbi:MAG: winged helix DNA-binding protein [Bacillota bacterium]|nr:winged helix DNA-binding protein [Bacillota bacterium]